MSDLLGYEGIDRLYEFTDGLAPILLLGPAGLGKSRWCQTRAEEFAGKSMTKVLTFPRVADLDEYAEIYAGQFKNSWSLDLTQIFSGKATNLLVVPALASFLRKASNPFTRVFLHSDNPVSPEIRNLVTEVSVPLLSDSAMRQLCKERGFEYDETEFAVDFAQGIPGDISTAFSVLKRRTMVFEFRELLMEDKIGKMEDEIKKSVKSSDIMYLHNILNSFDTGKWTLFKEHEVAFLKRVQELMRNVLSYTNSNAEISFVTVFHAAAHAYHGRV